MIACVISGLVMAIIGIAIACSNIHTFHSLYGNCNDSASCGYVPYLGDTEIGMAYDWNLDLALCMCYEKSFCGRNNVVRDDVPSAMRPEFDEICGGDCSVNIRCGSANVWVLYATGIPPEYFWPGVGLVAGAVPVGLILGFVVSKLMASRTAGV